ncbi:hypothetical protein [Owenweeksia hongkongensis]|uniref:hypothetical protein n=1 Tax=Owenweeksia hongkongensis TaxID=253245 RepID=UPI003A958986
MAKYVVYSNLWVGIAVGAFSLFTMSSFSTINVGFILMVIFSTAFTYNYMRFVQIRGYDLRNEFSFKAWVAGHRSEVLLFMLVFGALTGLAFIEIFSVELILLMILPGIISAAYPLSFKNPFSSFTSLRTAPGLKMFLISATWSYVTVIVPTVLYDALSLESVLEFLMRTLLILALVIPFDIRDVPYDDAHMKTIPQVIGRDQARQLSMLFILLYQVWLLVRLFVFGDPVFYTIALLVGLEIGYWLVRYSHREHSELYFSFWIEGVPIFCGVLLMVGSLVF